MLLLMMIMMMESGSSRIKVIIMIIIVAYFWGAARTNGIKFRIGKIIATAARHKVGISSYTATCITPTKLYGLLAKLYILTVVKIKQFHTLAKQLQSQYLDSYIAISNCRQLLCQTVSRQLQLHVLSRRLQSQTLSRQFPLTGHFNPFICSGI